MVTSRLQPPGPIPRPTGWTPKIRPPVSKGHHALKVVWCFTPPRLLGKSCWVLSASKNQDATKLTLSMQWPSDMISLHEIIDLFARVHLIITKALFTLRVKHYGIIHRTTINSDWLRKRTHELRMNDFILGSSYLGLHHFFTPLREDHAY